MAYRNAIERNPSNPRSNYLYGSFLLNQRNYAKAESVLSRGLNYSSRDYDLLYTYGIALAKVGKTSLAVKTWNDGLKLAEDGVKSNPNVAEHIKFVGLFSARLGFREKAISNGMKAVSIDSSDNEIVLGMARIYALLQQKEQMIEWFSRARRLNPEYDEGYIKSDLDLAMYREDADLLFAAKK
jgi:tetratricopeptide (TPR) repeat protein